MSANKVDNWVSASDEVVLHPLNVIQHGTSYFTADTTIGTGTRKRRWKTSAAVNNTSATFIMAYEVELPRSFVPGSYTCNVRAHVDVNPNTTKTVDLLVWKMGDDGITTGSDLVSTSAQSVTTTDAEYAFTVNLSGLLAGERLFVEVQMALDDSGGTGDKFGFINKVALSGSLRGGVWG